MSNLTAVGCRFRGGVVSRKGKTLKELQRSGSADWPNIESLRFLPFLRQLAEEYGDGAEGDTMRAAAETIATQRARNEALDDYCEKLRYQTVNQDAVIANLQARIEELTKLIGELYYIACLCPADRIPDDYDFFTPLEQAETLLREEGE